MKHALVLLLGFGLFGCGGSDKVEVGNRTTMEINPVFDAGTVIKGEVINAKFTLTNTGDFPLVLADVKGSCTCTVAEFPKEPLNPGESGEILAYINTDKTGTGSINKRIDITANTNPHITQVFVKGKVVVK